uniref:Uncharacterized protein n=2 Tax=Physcomitrium patens TaxID=3218 RepID=A0A7I4E3A6_PHYPA
MGKSEARRHKEEFRQLTQDDFGDMKLATHITESWYNCVCKYCPPKSNKMMQNQGGGDPVENWVTFGSGRQSPCNPVATSVAIGFLAEHALLSDELHNPDTKSTKSVITSDQANHSETPLRANAIVVCLLFNAMVLKMMLCMLVWIII